MGINDWRPILSHLDSIGEDISKGLRLKLEKDFECPEALLASVANEYQEICSLNISDPEERIFSVARQLLWPTVAPIQEGLYHRILTFIEEPETKEFIESDPLPKTAKDRIRIKEFGNVRRKYIESVQDEFAQRLLPYVKEALAKPEPAKPFRSPITSWISWMNFLG